MWDRLLGSWWGQILLGLLCFLLSGLTYWYISGLEANGGRGRVNWLIAIVYNLAGIWGCVLLFAIPGVVLIGIGIRNLVVQSRDNDEN